MEGYLRNRQRAILIAPVLALVALTIFATFPHWWHEDASGRFCSICQASRLPAFDDAARATLARPSLAALCGPPRIVLPVVEPALPTRAGRSPPA